MLSNKVIVFLLTLHGTLALSCGPNEQVITDCVGDCPTDDCPTSGDQNLTCATPAHCPKESCKCFVNYRRDANGTCIPVDQCPPFPCGKNEIYNACPPTCPETCADATLTGDCPQGPFISLFMVPCTPQCRCKRNYWRKNGICVPYADCSKIYRV